jgi:hypothetical protein
MGHEWGSTCRLTALQMICTYVLTSKKIIFSNEVYRFACRSVAANWLTSVGLPLSERSYVMGQRSVAGY